MSKARGSLTLQDFPHHTDEQIRFSDTDSLGHVNNIAFASFLETGRITMHSENGVLTRLEAAGGNFVVAQLNLGYHAEMIWPNKVKIGTGVKKIGRSSVTLLQGIFQGSLCAATAEVVLVFMDSKTRKSTPLPQEVKEILGELTVLFEI